MQQGADDKPQRNQQQRDQEAPRAQILKELAPGDEADLLHAARPFAAAISSSSPSDSTSAELSLSPAIATKTSCKLGPAASKRTGVIPRATQAASSDPGSVLPAKSASQAGRPGPGGSRRATPASPA